MAYCEVYRIGGVGEKTCDNAISDGVQACVECAGAGRVEYPEAIPDCGCGRPGNHSSTCEHRKSFFDPFREPTEEEKAYIANRVAGMKPVQAYKEAGFPMHPQAHISASRLEDKPHIKRFMATVLDKHGLTDDFLAERVHEGCLATEVQVRQIKKDGVTTLKEIARPDWQARARHLEMAFRLKGHLDKVDGEGRPTKITVVNKHSRKGETVQAIEVKT